jgi:hypothetical protein
MERRPAQNIVHRERMQITFADMRPSDIGVEQMRAWNVWILTVPGNKGSLEIKFPTEEGAHRVAKAFVHAAALCGVKPDPFR